MVTPKCVMMRSVLGLALTESAFQNTVLELAKIHGWLCYHTYNSRRSVPGFPDLVLAKGGLVLMVECKTDTGTISNDQIAWLLSAQGVIWRPKHWDVIEKSLKDGRAYETEPIPRMR